MQEPPRTRRNTPIGQTGAGHALFLPLWDPPTVLRRLGEGVHVPLPAELGTIRLGSAPGPEVDVYVDHPSLAAHHATLERLDESLIVRDAGTGQTLEFDSRTETFTEGNGFIVNVGDQFALGTVRLMPLERRLASLVAALEKHVGHRAHVRLDEALVAIVAARPLCIETTEPLSSFALPSSIHAASPRREHPLTLLDRLPESPEAVAGVCTPSACGMLVVDLRGGTVPTDAFLDALRSRRYHLWPCFVVEPGPRHPLPVAELNPHWL